MGEPAAPVEYSVAVERFLDAARLGAPSLRVYRIALHTWGWLLVDRLPPGGTERRGAFAPIVPLARLDGPAAARRLAEAVARRSAAVDPRTLRREVSILRRAVSWWAARGWLEPCALDGVRVPEAAGAGPGASDLALPPARALSPEQVGALFSLRSTVRERTCWNLVYEGAAPIERVLALDIGHLDLVRRRTRRGAGGGPDAGSPLAWGAETARLLPLLLAGRYAGPVFLTDRRAPPGTAAGDRCPATGRARLSYRRAAEVFQEATRPLDGAAGHGWTLRQLRLAGKAATTGGGS